MHNLRIVLYLCTCVLNSRNVKCKSSTVTTLKTHTVIGTDGSLSRKNKQTQSDLKLNWNEKKAKDPSQKQQAMARTPQLASVSHSFHILVKWTILVNWDIIRTASRQMHPNLDFYVAWFLINHPFLASWLIRNPLLFINYTKIKKKTLWMG